MNPPGATISLRKSNSFPAVVWGGLACGVLDITAALIVYGYLGAKPLRLLQGIAGGLLGPPAYSGGIATALLGLLCHFVIAFSAAAVYVAASRVTPFLVRHAVPGGALYGIAVYFFMSRVVVPLSAAVKFPFSVKMMVIGIIIHTVCVGLPISLAARRYAELAV